MILFRTLANLTLIVMGALCLLSGIFLIAAVHTARGDFEAAVAHFAEEADASARGLSTLATTSENALSVLSEAQALLTTTAALTDQTSDLLVTAGQTADQVARTLDHTAEELKTVQEQLKLLVRSLKLDETGRQLTQTAVLVRTLSAQTKSIQQNVTQLAPRLRAIATTTAKLDQAANPARKTLPDLSARLNRTRDRLDPGALSLLAVYVVDAFGLVTALLGLVLLNLAGTKRQLQALMRA